MASKTEFDPRALTDLRGVDPPHQRRILEFLRERVAPLADARSLGQALRGPLGDLWKYRVGDFLTVCDIQDRVARVLVVRVGHRREIYRR